MTEDFLHYIWQHQLFNLGNLTTIEGESVTVLNPGMHNLGSGPDFGQATIRISELTWVGNVEIHVKSSNWYQHNHQHDSLYDKTILHVVWEDDKPVYDNCKNKIPTIALSGRVSSTLCNQYHTIALSNDSIMCKGFLFEVSAFHLKWWLDRMLIERLEEKTELIQSLLKQYNSDWEQAFFILLCRNIGMKTNSEGFELLAKSIPFKILLKRKEEPLILESILFGVSGLLDQGYESDYLQQLKKEFVHQKHKYGLVVLDKSIWKFGGVRPSSFPTIRISQLASLITIFGSFFDSFVRNYHNNLEIQLTTIKTSLYWDTHYQFGKDSRARKKKLGVSLVRNLLINAIAPMMFHYGNSVSSVHHSEQALKVLENIPAENNYITRNWAQNNIFAKSASDSQGLIQLTNKYCKLKKCLNCGIGKQILKNETS